MIRYKIYLVQFPFSEKQSTKVRPALALSEKIGAFDHIIFAFISSQISENQSEFEIQLSETCLLRDSVLKLEKLVSLPKELVMKELGELNDSNKNTVKNKLKKKFAILVDLILFDQITIVHQ